MKKLDIEQAEHLRKKFASDWEIRKGLYLYKKVALDDYNQVLRFLMAVEKPQIKLDHFADFMNFYNELTIGITTHDVNGLTELDFELALYIDKALEQMGARQLDEKWSAKYKKSINCSNPKGFSQKAHCAGRKKNESIKEGFKLKLERDTDVDVLHIVNTDTGGRTEVRGKKGYESGNYDANDQLHQLLDRVGKSANIAELINGEVVSINPKHPDGAKAKTATDKAYNESKSADLYHSTHDDESFVSILKSGAIKPNFDHEHTTEKDPRPYISLSRDKRFDMFGSLPITLVIDQTKLGSSHKIVPYDSFASDDDFEKRSSGSSEAEERVYKPIPISYIKYVILRNANWVDSQAVLAAAKTANIPVVDLNGKPITENFADGKKKGKSRPGRVKRAGASCNGSVTSLRKRAKNSSGEKARMYHWCANMKSGRKKK